MFLKIQPDGQGDVKGEPALVAHVDHLGVQHLGTRLYNRITMGQKRQPDPGGVKQVFFAAEYPCYIFEMANFCFELLKL